MDAYYAIIQRTIKSNHIFFPKIEDGDAAGRNYYKNVYTYEKDKINSDAFLTLTWYDAIYYAYVSCEKNKYNIKKRTKVKFEILTGVLNNIFFNDQKKEAFFNVFTKVQKTYKAFAKFARLFKIRIAKVQITEDLYMNPINARDKNVISVYQRGSIYLFAVRDMINIINKSLSNNQDYFCEPLHVKNPYTNIKFSYAILYNIYFFIKQSSMIMPQLLHLYFMSNFDLEKFSINNECALRDICIYNYVFNTPSDFLYDKIMYMILTNTHSQKWVICKEFDSETLVRIMLPYFHLYEISNYSLNPDKKRISWFELNMKLQLFYKFNPLFGRRAIVPHSGTSPVINMTCPDFHKLMSDKHKYDDSEYDNIEHPIIIAEIYVEEE